MELMGSQYHTSTDSTQFSPLLSSSTSTSSQLSSPSQELDLQPKLPPKKRARKKAGERQTQPLPVEECETQPVNNEEEMERATALVLEWYKQGKEKFVSAKNNFQKSSLWKEASDMLKAKGLNQNAKIIYHNAKKKYKSERAKQLKSGSDPSEWELFDLAETVFSLDHDVVPPVVVETGAQPTGRPQAKKTKERQTFREQYIERFDRFLDILAHATNYKKEDE